MIRYIQFDFKHLPIFSIAVEKRFFIATAMKVADNISFNIPSIGERGAAISL
jgi:hypothetical protein